MGWRNWRLAVLAALKMRLNLNCPLAFVPGYLVLNWMETEDPTTNTTGMDGSEGKPERGRGEVMMVFKQGCNRMAQRIG